MAALSKILVLFFVLFSFSSLAQEIPVTPVTDEAETQIDSYKNNLKQHAQLQGLNKITAITSELNVEIGKPTQFGNLEISLHECWESPPEEEPESKAIIEVWEKIPGEEKKHIFKGWVFSSSPAVSALEHPVYGLTLIKCYDLP